MPRDEQLPIRRAAGLAIVVFAAAALLSVKTAVDLIPRRDVFPSWFVPLFVAGLGGLVLSAAWVTSGIWRARRYARPAAGALGGTVWIFLALSFVATSTVHQLYPFRTLSSEGFLQLDPVLRFNLVLTGAGLRRGGGAGRPLPERPERGGARRALRPRPPSARAQRRLREPLQHLVDRPGRGVSPDVRSEPVREPLRRGGAARRPSAVESLLSRGACAGVALLGLGHSTHVLW